MFPPTNEQALDRPAPTNAHTETHTHAHTHTRTHTHKHVHTDTQTHTHTRAGETCEVAFHLMAGARDRIRVKTAVRHKKIMKWDST